MKSRLVSLRTNGASVFVCRGKGKFGSYHPKGLVIDRKYLYYGSPNLTDKSTDNDEWPFRSTGEVVASEVLLLDIRCKSWKKSFQMLAFLVVPLDVELGRGSDERRR